MLPMGPRSPLCPEHLQGTPQHAFSATLSCQIVTARWSLNGPAQTAQAGPTGRGLSCVDPTGREVTPAWHSLRDRLPGFTVGGWGGGRGGQSLMGDQEQSKLNLVHNVPSGWALSLELSSTDTQVSNVKRTLCTFKLQRAKPNEQMAEGQNRRRFQIEGPGSGPGTWAPAWRRPGVGQTPRSLPPSYSTTSRVTSLCGPHTPFPPQHGEAAPNYTSTC